MSVFQRDGQALVVRFNGEILRLEPWERTACGCGP